MTGWSSVREGGSTVSPDDASDRGIVMTAITGLPRRPTPHLLRVEMAHTIGRIVLSNGRSFAIPLYHRRPPEPFQPRITRTEAIALNRWMDAIPTIGKDSDHHD